MPEPAPVTVTSDDGVLVITLSRPEALNAVDARVSALVGNALEQAAADDRVRAVIVTGTGRSFCAGMDLKAYARGEEVGAPGHPEWGFAGLTQHIFDKPLIAAVNGFALGGGCELVLACDLVVASTSASFGLPEVSRGLIAGGGGVFRLPRVVPRRVAAAMILTGRPISAADALGYGLVNQVVAAEDLLPAAQSLARAICANGPLAVSASKRLLRESWRYGSDWDEGVWTLNDQVVEQILASDDSREGALAFGQKRLPVWTGR
jgi:crotonobetainyl-CoA hydratase